MLTGIATVGTSVVPEVEPRPGASHFDFSETIMLASLAVFQ